MTPIMDTYFFSNCIITLAIVSFCVSSLASNSFLCFSDASHSCQIIINKCIQLFLRLLNVNATLCIFSLTPKRIQSEIVRQKIAISKFGMNKFCFDKALKENNNYFFISVFDASRLCAVSELLDVVASFDGNVADGDFRILFALNGGIGSM